MYYRKRPRDVQHATRVASNLQQPEDGASEALVTTPLLSKEANERQASQTDDSQTEEDNESDEDNADRASWLQEQSEIRAPEKLENEGGQYFALGCGCVALPLVMLAQSAPLSCTQVDETQKDWLINCTSSASGKIRLSPFCMKTCMRHQTDLFILLQGVAVGLQAIIVMMSHPHCLAWMRVSAHGDMQKEIQTAQNEFDQVVKNLPDQGSNAVTKAIRKRATWYMSRHFLSLFAQARNAAATNHSMHFMPNPKFMRRMSQLCNLVALAQIGVLIGTTYTRYPVRLHCDMHGKESEPLTLQYSLDKWRAGLYVLAMGILGIVVGLQWIAKYSKQVHVEGNIRNVTEFKEHFFAEGGEYAKHMQPPTMKEEPPTSAGRWSSSSFSRIFNAPAGESPESGDGCQPDTDAATEERIQGLQKDLQALHLCKLRRVTHGKPGQRKTETARLAWENGKKGPWEGPVILHFRGHDLLKLPENTHRTCAWFLTVVGATSLYSASQLCWECADTIHVRDGLTDVELQQVVKLAGACGRQAPIGTGSFVGFFMMVASTVLQLLLFCLTDDQFNHGGLVRKAITREYPKEVSKRQLWARLFTHNSTILNYEVYHTADAPMPKIWCHVWVKIPGQDKTSEKAVRHEDEAVEIVQDCDVHGRDAFIVSQEGCRINKVLEAERRRWVKSRLPTEVQLRAPPLGGKLRRSILGLVRAEYGLPVLCVETPLRQFNPLSKAKQDFDSLVQSQTTICSTDCLGSTANSPMNTQLVPMQFVAGGANAWVNCGSKVIWEKLAGALPCGAFLLGSAELLCHFMLKRSGHTITTCDDILNTDCFFFNNKEEGQPIMFRHALGLWASCCGCAISLLASLCLRVANQVDVSSVEDEEDDESPSSTKEPCEKCFRQCFKNCTCMYIEAVCFHVNMLMRLLLWWPYKYACAICCSPVDQGTRDEDKGPITDIELPGTERVVQ